MQTGRDRRIAIADDSPMFVEAARKLFEDSNRALT